MIHRGFHGRRCFASPQMTILTAPHRRPHFLPRFSRFFEPGAVRPLRPLQPRGAAEDMECGCDRLEVTVIARDECRLPTSPHRALRWLEPRLRNEPDAE